MVKLTNFEKLLLAEREQKYDVIKKCKIKNCDYYNKNYKKRCSVGLTINSCARASN